MIYRNFTTHLLLFCLMILSGTTSAMAQEKTSEQPKKYAFHIDFDKKIIHVDSLNMPKSLNVASLLRMLPELLERPGEDLTTNYDMKINGVSLGSIYDAAIEQLQIAGVERIEVCESPISTYEKNGQGGSIDIILRDKSVMKEDRDDPFWGIASIGAMYQTHLTPHLQMNYKKKKFSIKGIALGEFLNQKTDATTSGVTYTNTSATKERERNEFVGAYMTYNLTAKDVLELKLTESYNYNRKEYSQFASGFSTEQFDTVRSTQFRGLLSYKHTFSPRTKFQTEAVYGYSKNRNGSNTTEYDVDKVASVNTISGNASVTHRLFQGRTVNYGDIEVGADYSFAFDNSDTYQKNLIQTVSENILSDGKSSFVMPHLKWTCRLGNFLLQAQGEYQIFTYDIKRGSDRMATYRRNDFTGSLIMEQQIGKPHHLRLLMRRNIKRPALAEVYPFATVIPSYNMMVKGNSDLLPILYHEVSLDYISRYQFGDHKLTIDINTSYNHISDIVAAKEEQVNISHYKHYTAVTFLNGGKADQLSANLMLFYKLRTFSMSFTGNLYHMHSTDYNDTEQKGTYYNLAIMPGFDLPSGWNSSLYVAYHSKVKKTGSELDHCAYTQLNIGKTFGRCNIYFYQRSAFTGYVTDLTFGSKETIEKSHPLINSSIGLGMQYHF